MKFVTYKSLNSIQRFGFIKDDCIVDILRASSWAYFQHSEKKFLEIPSSLKGALKDWSRSFALLEELDQFLADYDLSQCNANGQPIAMQSSDVSLLPPVPNPSTVRDFYAFEQHVKSARRRRGLDMNPDWYTIPVFYYSNPNALFGHKASIPYPTGTEALDFELELAIIISNGGKNIPESEADMFIGGYTVLNDWSARDVQQKEMALGLGPAKGKDFATSMGPAMITPDELNDVWKNGKLHLSMTAYKNNEKLSEGNADDLYHSFPVMIERASANTLLMAGDIIGSGTVGTGCILELRPENTKGWLKQGDTVRLEIEKIGVLENTIV